ncbi:MAG: TIR domain-containing protein [Anaerolineae bacterium]|nr:TIR domain-containing protein [Anaerolineae bacterium]
MSHIFISYSKKDIQFARHLRGLLQDHGFKVWMDETKLVPSDEWWPTIEKNIETSSAFIVIMSPRSHQSRWVTRELLYAENLDKPICPVLLEGIGWSRLAEKQYADMRGGIDAVDPVVLVRLLDGLRTIVPAGNDTPLPPQLSDELMTAEYPKITTAELSSPFHQQERDGDSSAETSPSKPSLSPTYRKTGAIVGLLAVVAVIAIGLVIALSGNGGKGDDGDDTAIDVAGTRTAAAVIVVSPDTPTVSPSPEPSDVPTNTLPPEPTVTLTEAPSITPRPTDSPIAAPTSIPTNTPTEAPSNTSRPTSTPTVEPTAPPTITPRPTIPPTLTEEIKETKEPDDVTPTATVRSNVRLVYDQTTFVLINTSRRTLDISDLWFERRGTRVYCFSASEWDKWNIYGETSAMRAGKCYQVDREGFEHQVPASGDCDHLDGWFSTGITLQYFWWTDEPGATFTVHEYQGGPVLATCEIDAGDCRFYLP